MENILIKFGAAKVDNLSFKKNQFKDKIRPNWFI
jgi:hypothetical protein